MLIFVIWEISISMIRRDTLFFRSRTVPETPLRDPFLARKRQDCLKEKDSWQNQQLYTPCQVEN